MQNKKGDCWSNILKNKQTKKKCAFICLSYILAIKKKRKSRKLYGTYRKLHFSWNIEFSPAVLEHLPYCWPKGDPAVEKHSLLELGTSSAHLSECNGIEARWGDALGLFKSSYLCSARWAEVSSPFLFIQHSGKEVSWCLIIQNSLMLLYIACVIPGWREVSLTPLFEAFPISNSTR